jgi:Ca2+-binding EF-hand superfamily protein
MLLINQFKLMLHQHINNINNV